MGAEAHILFVMVQLSVFTAHVVQWFCRAAVGTSCSTVLLGTVWCTGARSRAQAGVGRLLSAAALCVGFVFPSLALCVLCSGHLVAALRAKTPQSALCCQQRHISFQQQGGSHCSRVIRYAVAGLFVHAHMACVAALGLVACMASRGLIDQVVLFAVSEPAPIMAE